MAAVKALRRFDRRSSFSTWLYRITTNVCIDELRRRRRRPLLGVSETRYETPAAVGPATESPFPAAAAYRASDRNVAAAEVTATKIEVDEALGALPMEFRVAVVLRDMCDLSYDEIATSLDIPVGTVRSRIARGRAAIAEMLEAETRVGRRTHRDENRRAGNDTELPSVQSP